MNEQRHPEPVRRWASVLDTARYGAIGLSKCWQMITRGDIYAIRNGRKVICDLNSLDRHYERVAPPVMTARELGMLDDPAERALHDSDLPEPLVDLTFGDADLSALQEA
jgi:hypothetical protein